MSIPVDLAELADAASRHDFAYLVTITDGGAAHLVAVQPVVEDRGVRVTGLGRRTLDNAAARPQVTLAWPPRAVGEHSLFVDGVAQVSAAGDAGTLVVTPSRAVLHRPAPAPATRPTEDASGCVSDCVEVPLRTESSS